MYKGTGPDAQTKFNQLYSLAEVARYALDARNVRLQLKKPGRHVNIAALPQPAVIRRSSQPGSDSAPEIPAEWIGQFVYRSQSDYGDQFVFPGYLPLLRNGSA